jgi:hypothetical protein
LVLIAAISSLAYAVVVRPAAESGLQAAKTGVVLDAETRQPLAGVTVVARWLEETSQPELLGYGGKIAGQCLFRVVVRTDNQGRYVIPATNFKLTGNLLPDRSKKTFWDLYTYSTGYGVASREPGLADAGDSPVQETQTLQPILLAADHAPAAQRVSALVDTLSRFTCEPYSVDPVPVAQQVVAEAYAAACLPEPNEAARLLVRLRHDAVASASVSTEDAEQPCMQLRQARNEPQK